MTGLVVAGIALSAGSISRVIIRWRAASITKGLAEMALQGCPAELRPELLRASAELAEGLGAENSSVLVSTRSHRRHEVNPDLSNASESATLLHRRPSGRLGH